MTDNTRELYFVAYFKHGQIQHLVAGPFIDPEDCDIEINKHKYSKDRYVIVRTVLSFELVDD